MMVRVSLVSAALLVATACGGPKSADKVDDQPIQGEIAGVPFDLGGASAILGDGNISIELYGSSWECGDPQPEGNYVLFGAPDREGEWELQLNLFRLDEARTVTLFDVATGTNIIVNKGLYAIENLGDEEFDLVLYANGKDQGSLEGRATLAFCNL